MFMMSKAVFFVIRGDFYQDNVYSAACFRGEIHFPVISGKSNQCLLFPGVDFSLDPYADVPVVGFDLNKNDGIILSGDYIDLSFRTAIISFHECQAFLFQIPVGDILSQTSKCLSVKAFFSLQG